jgi:hypothetical protein
MLASGYNFLAVAFRYLAAYCGVVHFFATDGYCRCTREGSYVPAGQYQVFLKFLNQMTDKMYIVISVIYE